MHRLRFLTSAESLMKQPAPEPAATSADRLQAWAHQVEESCVPMVYSMTSEGAFEGEMLAVENGGLHVSKIAAVDHVAKYRRRAMSSIEDDYLLVSIQSRNRSAIEQDGRVAVVYPGDMVLFDASRDFEWHFSGEHYTVRFPRQLLTGLAPLSRQHTAVRIPGGDGIRRIATEHVATVHRELLLEPTCGEARAGLAGVTAHLVAVALADFFNRMPSADTSLRAMHIVRARRFIDEHLRDPELNPDRVAAALGLSSRYLYRLFSHEHESMSERIITGRLDGCAAWLRQPAYAHLSITEIAMTWGFNDPSHFSRAFRRHAGVSAREYRRLRGAGAGRA
jgi:AraC-like DNA-binding protein